MIMDAYIYTPYDYAHIKRPIFNFFASKIFTKKAFDAIPDNVTKPFMQELICSAMTEICRIEKMPLSTPSLANLQACLRVENPNYARWPYVTDWIWKDRHFLRVKAPHPKEKRMTYREGKRSKLSADFNWEVTKQTFTL